MSNVIGLQSNKGVNGPIKVTNGNVDNDLNASKVTSMEAQIQYESSSTNFGKPTALSKLTLQANAKQLGVPFDPGGFGLEAKLEYEFFSKTGKALAKQKLHPAFDAKAAHDQAASVFSKAEERRTEVNREVEDAQHEHDANAAHLKRLYDQIMKAEEEKAKVQADVAAAQADKVTCDEAYSKAKSNLEIFYQTLKDQSNLRATFNNAQENPSFDEEIDHKPVVEKPSSNKEYVHDHPDLSKLKPPSRSDGFRVGKEHLEALKGVSLVLISNIKEAADANEMIDLSSKAFTYFDSIGVDYMPVYKAVCSVIRHHCDKEALAKQKPHPAFDTKATHDQAASEFSKAEERYTTVNREVEDVQHELDAFSAHLKRLYDQVNKANEEEAKLETKVAGAQADKVTCGEAYSKAKSKLQKISPEMSEAQKAIDDFERRWKETNNGLDRAMEELSSLRSSLVAFDFCCCTVGVCFYVVWGCSMLPKCSSYLSPILFQKYFVYCS
ncbi:hypothetical protein L1987_25753 [Smallanthus sonchifolius]|uniref:Uncharacterized protein n=1 Tax=Smallanthus sonchifolius TaxID=185202 RepID=A0ACB9I8A9_9ASTR|nr:hypothetical protein L1987_25753 [Smallanthus sonchifolius]